MMRFLRRVKKGEEKPDANISMNTHGGFSTGGYGNAKIGGRTVGTYFMAFTPIVIALVWVAYSICSQEPDYDRIMANPGYCKGVVIKNSCEIDYIYFVNGCKEYKLDASRRYLGDELVWVDDTILIVYCKDDPKLNYPIRNLSAEHRIRSLDKGVNKEKAQ